PGACARLSATWNRSTGIDEGADYRQRVPVAVRMLRKSSRHALCPVLQLTRALMDKPLLPYDSRVNPYFPHQILMETTSACQLRCTMCARQEALAKGTLEI